jgi:hypothetical protein
MNCFYPLNVFSYFFLSEPTASVCYGDYQQITHQTSVTFMVYSIYFLLTLLFETPWYLIFGWIGQQKLLATIKQILTLNLATHPIIFWVIPYIFNYLNLSALSYIVIAEAFAFMIEMFILKFVFNVVWFRSFVTSLCANVFSWLVGVWLQTQGLL